MNVKQIFTFLLLANIFMMPAHSKEKLNSANSLTTCQNRETCVTTHISTHSDNHENWTPQQYKNDKISKGQLAAAEYFFFFNWMSKKKVTNQVISKGKDAAETCFQGVLPGMITSVSVSPAPSPSAVVSLPVWAPHIQEPALSMALAGRQKYFHPEVGVSACLCVCSTSGSCSPSFWEVLPERVSSWGAVGEIREFSSEMWLKDTFRTSQNNDVYRELQIIPVRHRLKPITRKSGLISGTLF